MTTNFTEFALSQALQDSLQAMQFTTPTPIQAQAIPLALEGRDVLGSAQTGTGKTGAFCVPMIDYLMKNPSAHALVMLPTRELAGQVHDVARKMIGGYSKGPEGIKTALLIGGEPIGKQYAQLDRRPRLIVGTPGRINDHLRSNPDLVDRVSFVVLDEADRMLDMGFSVQIDSILSETALERQTLMFSATFPDSIIKFSKQYLQNPERISVGVQSKPGENIIQENMNVPQEQKYDELLVQLQKREGSVIVFVRTKHGADKLAARLYNDEHAADALHGGLRQRQRDKVVDRFRQSKLRILIATDVAARGLDVPHIEHVINYDLPQVAEDYIHRIGRTARAGNKGHAVSFISPGERGLWMDIERMLDPSKKYESSLRDVGKKKSSGGGKFGNKSFGGRKPYGDRDQNSSRGDFKERKPFGRADRQDRREGGWNPANDFERSAPQQDRGFKKPFKKEGDFARDPDAYKRTNSGERREGGFKKSFGRDGARSNDRPQGNRFERDGNRDGNRAPRGERSEGGFKKPFNRDGASSDRPRFNNDRPQRSEGNRSEGGFKKPFKKDGDRSRNEGNGGRSFDKKPFAKKSNDGFAPRSGGAKRVQQKNNASAR